jgi:putative transposase
MEKGEKLDTIWEVPDELWEEIESLIMELDPPKPTGRKRANPRLMLNGIIYRMRSSCQWNHLPKDLGDDSTIHRTFQRWEACGLFPRIWTTIQSRCDELGGVDWDWQSADTAMGKARMGGTSPIASGPPTGASLGASVACW